MPVTVDRDTMTATVKASIGFQEFSDFKVNFGSDQITTYATSCSNCAEYPYYATNYFNVTGFDSYDTYLGPEGPYDGYSYEVSEIETQYCLAN